MAARSSAEEQRRKRRRRLLRGLLLGGAAVGVPAFVNALVARRARRLEAPTWGQDHLYAWRHGEISFRRLGQGTPVLLVHSLGAGHDAEEWSATAEILARNYSVFAPDLLGWGRSDKPPLEYDGVLYIQLIQDFLEDVVQERTIVIATGLCSAYALQVAVDAPEAVRGLGLVAPTGIGVIADEPDLKDAVVNRLLRLPILGTSALNLYTSHAGLTQYLRELFAAPERVDAALIEHHYRSSHQPGAHHALAAYVSGYLNHPAGQSLSRISQPLWIGWGREAKAPPVESADLWLRHAPNAELEVFDDAGNLPHVEIPNQFCRQLELFLARLSD